MWIKLIGIISVGFDITDQVMIRFSTFIRYWRKKWESNETVHQLFIDFKNAYVSVRTEVLYNFQTVFGVLMKQVRLIKICLSEMYSKVHRDKCLSDNFPIQIDLKQVDASLQLLLYFVFDYAIRTVLENQVELKLNGTRQLLSYVDDVNLLGNNIYTIKKNTKL
jgi:hypothetical protein